MGRERESVRDLVAPLEQFLRHEPPDVSGAARNKHTNILRLCCCEVDLHLHTRAIDGGKTSLTNRPRTAEQRRARSGLHSNEMWVSRLSVV